MARQEDDQYYSFSLSYSSRIGSSDLSKVRELSDRYGHLNNRVLVQCYYPFSLPRFEILIISEAAEIMQIRAAIVRDSTNNIEKNSSYPPHERIPISPEVVLQFAPVWSHEAKSCAVGLTDWKLYDPIGDFACRLEITYEYFEPEKHVLHRQRTR